MLDIAPARIRRKPSLTPMIDVVFLLLVFFMLSARFGQDQAITLNAGGASTSTYSGPPRLIEVREDGLLLNGIELTDLTLLDSLQPLMERPEDVVILRSADEAKTQRLVDVLTLLSASGITNVALIE